MSLAVESIVMNRYLVILPDDYDPATRYPLIMFLHGSGERGSNLAVIAPAGGPMETIKDLGIQVILVTLSAKRMNGGIPMPSTLFLTGSRRLPHRRIPHLCHGAEHGRIRHSDYITTHLPRRGSGADLRRRGSSKG